MIRSIAHLRVGRRSIFAAVVAALAIAGAAVAYFSSTGTGSGSAPTGTMQTLTLTAGTPSAQLYPGGTSDVAVTISNPNPVRAHVGSLMLDTSQGSGGFAADSSHSGCSVSALSFVSQTNGGAGWFVGPKVGSSNGSLTVDLAHALSMSASAANACQGASFTVYLAAGS